MTTMLGHTFHTITAFEKGLMSAERTLNPFHSLALFSSSSLSSSFSHFIHSRLFEFYFTLTYGLLPASYYYFSSFCLFIYFSSFQLLLLSLFIRSRCGSTPSPILRGGFTFLRNLSLVGFEPVTSRSPV